MAAVATCTNSYPQREKKKAKTGDCAQNLVVMRWRYYATHRYNAPGHEPHWQIFSEPYLRLVEFGAGDGGKGPPALVEGLAAREQHLSIQKHGHGFTHA